MSAYSAMPREMCSVSDQEARKLQAQLEVTREQSKSYVK